jgi:hypothetical protein
MLLQLGVIVEVEEGREGEGLLELCRLPRGCAEAAQYRLVYC